MSSELQPIAPPEAWGETITRENVSERAYLMLYEALMHGKLKPGERLLLRPLSRQFGISVTPMREALLRLVSKEALSLDARGTVVVPTLTRDQLLEIRDIRKDLEGRAAATAALHATPEAIEALAVIQARLMDSYRDGAYRDSVRLNTEFHLQLCRMARLPVVQVILESLWVRCGPILSHLYDEGTPSWEPHPHEDVLDALRAGDGDAARQAIRHDIEYGGQGLFEHAAPSLPDDA